MRSADGGAHQNDETPVFPGVSRGADARTRTWDPFITSEVLYQLSYVGAEPWSVYRRLSDHLE
jgi:hypothetical protein